MKSFSQLAINQLASGDESILRMGNILLANIPPLASRCLEFLDLYPHFIIMFTLIIKMVQIFVTIYRCSTFVSEKLDIVLLISLIAYH